MESHRQAALQILRTLRKRGHVAYFAGGCVRDELLGLTPEDYDIATDARPEQILRLYPRANEVGAAFGVMLVREQGVTVEVATFRKEWGYSDARRPDNVEYADEKHDALRRDFTINALFLDPTADPDALPDLPRVRGRVIDYVKGLDDLRSRLIRAVGEPAERLAEDHLRALRAVRFAARFQFGIEPRTRDAIREHARELRGVSRERIGDEVRRMLAGRGRRHAVRLLESLALDAPTLDDFGRAPGSDDARTLDRISDDAPFEVALAAWTLDRLAPSPAPESLGAALDAAVRHIRDALCLSNAERDRLRAMLAGLLTLQSEWPDLRVARQKRAAASPWFPDAIALLRAIEPDRADAVEARTSDLAATPSGLAPRPLLTGDDLLTLGLTGPQVGRGLDAAYDAQLEDSFTTREDAVRFVREAFPIPPDSRADTE